MPALSLLLLSSVAFAALPANFPKSGNALWYTQPANTTLWSTQMLPIGNGYLAAMLSGGTDLDLTQLNIESLWMGGPFQDPNYTGGNPPASEAPLIAQNLANFTSNVFSSSNGTIGWNISILGSTYDQYGTYAGAGWLQVNRSLLAPVSGYTRWLDLDSAVGRSAWSEGKTSFTRESFCSNPIQACVQHTAVSSSTYSATYSFLPDTGLGTNFTSSCLSNDTIQLRGTAGSPGMTYELLGKIQAVPSGALKGCANGVVTVQGSNDVTITWVGDTDYSMDAGNAANGFSFKGPDPHNSLVQKLNSAASSSVTSHLQQHLKDVSTTFTSPFSLDLGATPDLTNPTDVLVNSYQTDVGNPFLELLTFNYGRYMLWSSSRGVLPANLQGKWAKDNNTPWSGDYHSNINIQMNYWSAESTNLDVIKPLFDYIEKTWAPRGSETAKIVYGARGWTTHNEMNTFGHTGMKWYPDPSTPEWANYPFSATWMMLHVFDHFDYTNDLSWWRTQGYPLLKGVALFDLDRLTQDLHFKDGSAVVPVCNSPEQPITTFGCSHQQQIIWQLFNAIEKGFEASGDDDTAFLKEVQAAKAKIDPGIHIGSWGQLQEWKVDLDSPNDTHRHLSHLIGLYPGYAVANYDATKQQDGKGKTFSKKQVLDAAEISLIHRGNGTGPDADSGWEKVWRAAAWAQLKNTSTFYHELTYALERDFATNLFSVYDPFNENPIFQIDANLGYPAAVMNALLQAPDVPDYSTTLTVTVLPALPSAWAKSGSIKGARVRGGLTVDIAWSGGKLTKLNVRVDQQARAGRNVEVVNGLNGKVVASFVTKTGMEKSLVQVK